MLKRPEWLQNVLDFLIDNFSILLTVGFAGFVIYRQKISPTVVSTDELITDVLAVLGLLAISEIIERHRRLHGIEESTREVASLIRYRFADSPSAITYLRKPPDLQAYIQNASEIDLCGVCLTSTVNKLFSALREQLKRGAKIRLLLMAPNSQAVEMAGFRSEMAMKSTIRRGLMLLFRTSSTCTEVGRKAILWGPVSCVCAC